MYTLFQRKGKYSNKMQFIVHTDEVLFLRCGMGRMYYTTRDRNIEIG
jgi:hypothetical protein